MFDYLASGKIIISSNLPGIREILKDKINSLIVENNNVHQWNNAIKNILRNKKLSKKIGNSEIKFENFLLNKIMYLIPTIYLEDFNKLKNFYKDNKTTVCYKLCFLLTSTQ